MMNKTKRSVYAVRVDARIFITIIALPLEVNLALEVNMKMSQG